MYFTLPVCINFQRSSPAMWAAALKTWNDSETNYVFFPEKVLAIDYFKLQADLRKHSLSLQPNKHTTIWHLISTTLFYYYQSDPRNILIENNWDVVQILKHIRVDHKDRFKYLRGEKLSNYWLYILWQFTEHKFVNLNYLSIIPDTHVIQSTREIGLSDKLLSPEETAAIWFELFEGTDYYGIQLHPILWNWSRNNFLPGIG